MIRKRRLAFLVLVVAMALAQMGPAVAATGYIPSPCDANTANSHTGSTVITAIADFDYDCDWVQAQKLRYFDGYFAVTGTQYTTHPSAQNFSRTGYYLYWSVNRVHLGYTSGQTLSCNC